MTRQQYNWYDDSVAANTISHLQKKGIIGYTKEPAIGNQQGKPIMAGYENNQHLAPEDHKGAALSLHRRAQRIQQALDRGRVHPDDVPEVQAELEQVTSQRDLHNRRSVLATAPSPAITAAPVEKSLNRPQQSLVSRFRKLRAAISRPA